MKKLALALATLALATGTASAQDWPTKTVRIIAPFGPGSTPDVVARLLADHMQRKLGQTFIVENKVGAGGVIGTDTVAKAAPDGSTIGISIGGPLAINTLLMSKLPYNPAKDIAAVTQLITQPSALAVNIDLKVNTIAELIALLKKNPGKYRYATAGNGSPPHLAAELFKLKSGVDLLHVPYKGTGAAVPDVVSGQVQFMIDGPPPFLGHVKAGRLRALAAANDKRLEQMPDVPTFAEQGYHGMEAGLWYAMLAPKGTPQPVIKRLNAAINEVLKQPDVRQRFAASSVETIGGTPQECGNYIQAEIKRWGEVARAANIRIE